MASCSNCNNSTKTSSSSFYKEALDIIEKKLTNIPHTILDIIIDYAFVHHVKVSWNARLNIACNCVSCHYDKYHNNPQPNYVPTYDCRRVREITICLCSKCFVEGIARHPGRLPHSNTDCFLSNSVVEVDPYKYVLPKYYKLFYYRSLAPAEINGKLYISWV